MIIRSSGGRSKNLKGCCDAITACLKHTVLKFGSVRLAIKRLKRFPEKICVPGMEHLVRYISAKSSTQFEPNHMVSTDETSK